MVWVRMAALGAAACGDVRSPADGPWLVRSRSWIRLLSTNAHFADHLFFVARLVVRWPRFVAAVPTELPVLA